MHEVKALFFDVFGTLVDWRSSIAREAREILSPLGISLDWEAFADAWRDQYQPAMEEVRTGRLPFSKLDVLHRRNLDVVLKNFALEPLDEPTRVNLNLAWHRLDAWPDVTPGLARLRSRFLVAPCSNGNISLMVDLAPPQRLNLGCDSGGGDRARLQTLSRRLYFCRDGIGLQARGDDDGRGAFVGSRGCRGGGAAHRVHRSPERARSWKRRVPCRYSGRYFGDESHGSRESAGV